jgi:hypothetical protein
VSRDSSVGTATGLQARRPRNQGSNPSKGKTFFSCPYRQDRLWSLPGLPLLPGLLYPTVNRPGREADHSLSSSAEVMNDGAVPPLPLTS